MFAMLNYIKKNPNLSVFPQSLITTNDVIPYAESKEDLQRTIHASDGKQQLSIASLEVEKEEWNNQVLILTR